MTMVTVYLALGSNLGDRVGNLRSAVGHLSQKLTVKQVSSVYETEPVYFKEQPLYLNAALSAMTKLDPFQLLRFVKSVETGLGRQPGFRNAPRTIDIDILFYGDRIIESPGLTVPHPGIAERAFVLAPLAEIAPRMVHPVLRKRVSELLAAVEGLEGVKKFGEL